MKKIKIDICSPPDKEELVVAIMVGNRQFCELNQEGGKLTWEFYPNENGEPWVFDNEDLMVSIESAIGKLRRKIIE